MRFASLTKDDGASGRGPPLTPTPSLQELCGDMGRWERISRRNRMARQISNRSATELNANWCIANWSDVHVQAAAEKDRTLFLESSNSRIGSPLESSAFIECLASIRPEGSRTTEAEAGSGIRVIKSACPLFPLYVPSSSLNVRGHPVSLGSPTTCHQKRTVRHRDILRSNPRSMHCGNKSLCSGAKVCRLP